MKKQIRELVVESYECGDIDIDHAGILMDFVEYSDLGDRYDLDMLTEMVDALIDDGCMYYEATDKIKLSPKELDQKKAERRAKIKKVTGKVGKALGVGALIAGGAYGGYKASERRNRDTINELRTNSDKLQEKLQATKNAFRQANREKRGYKDTINIVDAKLGVLNDRFRGLEVLCDRITNGDY